MSSRAALRSRVIAGACGGIGPVQRRGKPSGGLHQCEAPGECLQPFAIRRERLEPPSVQFLIASDLGPVALTPCCPQRHRAPGLRTGLHVGRRQRVVALCGMRQQDAAVGVQQIEGPGSLAGGQAQFAAPRPARRQRSHDVRDTKTLPQTDPRVRQDAGDAELDREAAVPGFGVQHGVASGPGDASDVPRGEPIFGKVDGLLRLEQPVGFLVAKQSRLKLDVGAVIVRERLTPAERVPVEAPRPDFVGRQLADGGDVHGAGS